jgi:predicted N-acetyltransferase YhbS
MPYVSLPMRLDEHRDTLLALWTENMSDPQVASVAPERLRWYYEENPAGAPATNLIADDPSRDIIGCGSFFPRLFVIDGKPYRAGILSDFAVKAAHRSAGPAVTLQRALVERSRSEGMDFLITYPNRAAEPIFKRVGYKEIGGTQTWVKPLRTAGDLVKRLKFSLAATIAGIFADRALAVFDFFRSVRIARTLTDGGRLTTLDTASADSRFDDLWKRAAHQFRLTGERTSSYLNWRYTRFRSLQYRFFCLIDRPGDRISAYLVYTVKDNVVIIADLFSDDMSAPVDLLLLRFSSLQRGLGRRLVRADYVGPDSFGLRLKTLGFIQRPNQRSLFAYVSEIVPPDVKGVVLDKTSWLMFDAELDI